MERVLTLFSENRTVDLLVRRLLSLLSLLLVVIWLPATQHCALEAAGWIAQTCADDCEQGATAKDGCGTVESGAYKSSVNSLKVSAPDLLACVDSLYSYLVQSEAAFAPILLPSESFDQPQDWVSTWYFVRRAAPSPRAPSLSLA